MSSLNTNIIPKTASSEILPKNIPFTFFPFSPFSTGYDMKKIVTLSKSELPLAILVGTGGADAWLLVTSIPSSVSIKIFAASSAI